MDQFAPVPENELEDPVCPCCLVAYGEPGPEGEKPERPLKTLCNHIFGENCLDTWLPNNSCPLCRRKLYDGVEISDHMVPVGDGTARRTRIFHPLPRNNPAARQIAPEPVEIVLDDELEQYGDELFNSVQAAGLDDPIHFEFVDVPTVESRRWWRLYQDLGAEGHFSPGAEFVETLTWIHERALFRELQRRGAFNYPDMREALNFQRDIRIYRMLRLEGACWDHRTQAGY